MINKFGDLAFLANTAFWAVLAVSVFFGGIS